MSVIRSTDLDFRIFQISFDVLLEIQSEAEGLGWATRWTSVDALRSQVRVGGVILQSMMREERGGEVRAYRCAVLFRTTDERNAGGISTIDLSPERFFSLERIDRDVDVRKAFVGVFSLALGGISTMPKR